MPLRQREKVQTVLRQAGRVMSRLPVATACLPKRRHVQDEYDDSEQVEPEQRESPDHAKFLLRRPCRHLMEGDEDLGDGYSVILFFPWRYRLFGLIPLPYGWAEVNRQYWLPDIFTALQMVNLYLSQTPRALWDKLERGEFHEYEL